ncbi:hypothetical protein L198_03310 [Cryptococcus wingfieldii CBS 7118]|uniref:Glycosyltransferase 61 catalytic domain-containing protein n=1 Tax=Cryptococcus wingfieldii CBS 7118 TaxID=1295528 RepID=A0A1E3JH83_9TREE|nr:hypothetical protein L198_03310 [Cryptococcus wingfieldii CBS 7118]ODN99466.1 hypothetical protein L198_03310 [Cryptococcus wingfieldii CBS 7118]
MPTVSVLPAFLQLGSPPRSPHVERPSFLSSVFVPRESPSTPRGSPSMKPTRRDVLLCLLTLSFSYLLFSSPPSSDPVALSASGGNRYRIPGWSNFFPSSTGTSRSHDRSGEVLFTDSVKAVGVGSADVEFGKGNSWDGGEEEEEDDEFESMATVLKGHSPGWTMFEKLYIYNGSFYVITEDKEKFPELRLMTSTGLPANNEPGNSEAREPKGDEIIYISPMDAAKLWGPRVYRMDGTTFLFNDGQSVIDHYYHFAAELLLGIWRTYTSYDQDISPAGETSLLAPKRMWFLHQSVDEWRDNPRFNPLLMFNLFPQTSLLYPSDFADLAKQSVSSKPKAFVLDRAILADRSAAFRGPFTGPTARTVAGALQVGEASRWWWEPVRRTVLRYAGVPQSIISRNLEGYGAVDPVTLNDPTIEPIEPLAPPGDYAPVITYISRQNSRRRLTAESHAGLVQALEERAERLGWELVIVEAEKMTKEEQFALAGRTTIMLGVHGNGLTHLLWMPATPRSAVIEMFIQGGFARDYQWTAHALGIRHFGIQHDISFTSPALPEVDYPEGFQGTGITVVGKVVADLIEDRLAGRV